MKKYWTLKAQRKGILKVLVYDNEGLSWELAEKEGMGKRCNSNKRDHSRHLTRFQFIKVLQKTERSEGNAKCSDTDVWEDDGAN